MTHGITSLGFRRAQPCVTHVLGQAKPSWLEFALFPLSFQIRMSVPIKEMRRNPKYFWVQTGILSIFFTPNLVRCGTGMIPGGERPEMGSSELEGADPALRAATPTCSAPVRSGPGGVLPAFQSLRDLPSVPSFLC